jgi:hypothetical protein
MPTNRTKCIVRTHPAILWFAKSFYCKEHAQRAFGPHRCENWKDHFHFEYSKAGNHVMPYSRDHILTCQFQSWEFIYDNEHSAMILYRHLNVTCVTRGGSLGE